MRKVLLVHEQSKQQPSLDAMIIYQEKAFDYVNIQWLFQVLTYMGFLGNIIAFLRDLYISPTARICTPGALSSPIVLQKGTH